MNSKENSTCTTRVATIDDIQSDIGHLSLLLDTAVSVLMEMDFGVGPNRNHQLDRVNALLWIGRDTAEKLVDDCDHVNVPSIGVISTVAKTRAMNARVLPAPNMADWSITDLEQAYAGLVDMAGAGNGILNQPRSVRPRSNDYCDGAAFVEDVILSIDQQMMAIIDHATKARFSDPGHDDRRVRLLLRFRLDYPGMDREVPELIRLATEQISGEAAHAA